MFIHQRLVDGVLAMRRNFSQSFRATGRRLGKESPKVSTLRNLKLLIEPLLYQDGGYREYLALNARLPCIFLHGIFPATSDSKDTKSISRNWDLILRVKEGDQIVCLIQVGTGFVTIQVSKDSAEFMEFLKRTLPILRNPNLKKGDA